MAFPLFVYFFKKYVYAIPKSGLNLNFVFVFFIFSTKYVFAWGIHLCKCIPSIIKEEPEGSHQTHRVHTKCSLLLSTADGTHLWQDSWNQSLHLEQLHCAFFLFSPSAVKFHGLEQGVQELTPFCGWHLDSQGTMEEIVVVEKILVFCSYRMPWQKRKMSQCSRYKDWFHESC